MKQLELRKHEVEQLSKDFENKIRAKEVTCCDCTSMSCPVFIILECPTPV